VDKACLADGIAVQTASPVSFFPRSRFCAVTVCIALALLASVATTLASTIERFSLRHLDHAVEVDLLVQGSTPRWHLQSHGQELWLDLEHSHLAAPVEPLSALNSFPLTYVSMSDSSGGNVWLVLRVRGRVDYVVAQMPHAVVVRIAPSGQAVDLAQPLLAEMDRNRERSTSVAATTHEEDLSGRVLDQTVVADAQQRIPAKNGNITNPSMRAGPAISTSASAISANPLPGPSQGGRREPAYSQQAAAQTVQPVAQHITAGPWLGQARVRPLVVIDAGHGGFDPGTESAGGIAEKNVALAIAQRLAAALEARGVDTELTRNDDKFLSLEQRTDLANHAHADLFVSIHLNSSPDWNTSGIETYYLNNTTDRATIRLARIENGGDYGALGQSNLNYILANLRQDYKALESSSLARMIEVEAASSVDAETGITMHALGAKMGPFYVLVGAEMPSVLIECGFLSNPREAHFLLQPTYQQALADGIAMAIIHYFHADAAVGNL
jgi:N-acetylmuramoyl-L-alanine amidase